MNSQEIRVLVIEDNPGDARLVEERLAAGVREGWGLPAFAVAWADCLSEGLAHLDAAAAGEAPAIDVVLTDLDLPDSQADETFAALRRRFPQLPIVVLTGRHDAALARTTIRAGAQDYLFKSEATGSLLAHALTYAIERQQIHGELERCIEARTAALRESEATARVLLNAPTDAAFLMEPDGTILDLNDTMAQRFGHRREQLIGTCVHDLLSPELTEARRAKVAQVMAQKKPLQFEDERQGVWYHHVIYPVLDEQGEVVKIAVWARDITARKVAEERLRFQALLLDAVEQAIIATDLEGHVTYWNPFAEQLYGWTADEAQGRTTLELIASEESRAYGAEIMERLRAGESWCGRYPARRRDGTLFPTQVTVSPLHDGEGQLIGMIGISSDITARQRMEDALRQSEQRMKMLLENTDDIVIMQNFEGRYVYYNAPAVYGLSKEDLIGKQPEDFFEPSLAAVMRQRLEAVVQTGTAIRVEQRVNWRGEDLWFDDYMYPIKDERGKVRAVGTISRNITPRKDVQQSLHERIKELTCLYAVSRDMQKDLLVDELCRRVLDHLADAMQCPEIAVPVIELAQGRFAAAGYEEGLTHALSTEVRAEGEVLGHLTVYYTEERPFLLPEEQDMLDSLGQILGMWLRRQAVEQALLEALDNSWRRQAEVAALLDGAKAVLEYQEFERAARAIFDVCKPLIGASSGYVALLNADGSENEVLFLDAGGLPCTVDPELPMPIRGLRSEAYHTGQVVHDNDFEASEWTQFIPEGHVRLENVLFAPLTIEGEVVGLIGLANKPGGFTPDDRRIAAAFGDFVAVALLNSRTLEFLTHTQEMLRKNARELRRSNAELHQFAQTVSHDLKEPLRMVTSYLNLLERRYKDQLDETADEYIHFAVDGAERMSTLINDLLDYARISTRDQVFRPVDGADVLGRVLHYLQFEIEAAGATITHDELPVVRGDETQLVQLFQNLLGNALKFRGEEPPRVHISVAPEGEMWRFAVRDNGIGIAPEHHQHIFGVFRRLHSREAYEGTGIGLATCQKIVERHGGRIWVESALGRGATFFFTLPMG